MSWGGVKKQSNIENIKAWCEEMGIKNYTINTQGEIDVDGDVNLSYSKFKELPYKFGTVTDYFSMGDNKNLTSLKNCPDVVCGSFYCNRCTSLDSLEGCPKEVGDCFYCNDCKRKFEIEELMQLCNVRSNNLYL